MSAKDRLFAQLRGTTFQQFNEIIGLPKKNNQEYPIFDFQMQDVIDPLELGVKRILIKKPRKIGASELILRYIVWRCVRDDAWENKQVCILVTPREGLAIRQIKRIKNLFKRHNVYFDDKQSSLELNGVDISSYPGDNINAIRSLEDPALIFADEADYWDYSQIDEVRAAIEGYLAIDPIILLVSTPSRPRGLFQRIELEPQETCLYKRVAWTWRTGIGKIYTQADIDRARLSPQFEREMEGLYGGKRGSTFRTELLEKCKSYFYEPDYIPTWADKENNNIYMGVDPGYTENSQFAISIVRINEERNLLEVLYSSQFSNKDTPEMLDLCYELYDTYGPANIYIDAHEVSFVRQFKARIPGDDPNWKEIAVKAEHDNVDVEELMTVIPISFGEKGVEMLSNLRALIMEGKFAIHEKFQDLHTSLLTAVDKDLKLDKKATVFHDSLDSLRLACSKIYTDEEAQKEHKPLICVSLEGAHRPVHLQDNRFIDGPRDVLTLYHSSSVH